jgi:hypothetical protein
VEKADGGLQEDRDVRTEHTDIRRTAPEHSKSVHMHIQCLHVALAWQRRHLSGRSLATDEQSRHIHDRCIARQCTLESCHTRCRVHAFLDSPLLTLRMLRWQE